MRTFHKIVFAHTKFGLVLVKGSGVKVGGSALQSERVFKNPSQDRFNSALQRFMCELYYKFGSSLTPPSIGLITSRHYLSEQNVMGTKNGAKMDLRKEMSE